MQNILLTDCKLLKQLIVEFYVLRTIETSTQHHYTSQQRELAPLLTIRRSNCPDTTLFRSLDSKLKSGGYSAELFYLTSVSRHTCKAWARQFPVRRVNLHPQRYCNALTELLGN